MKTVQKRSIVFKPNWQGEGKGASVKRIIGNRVIESLDPFLMLDYAKVKLPAGFPDHPHRGFETVTYVIQGTLYHEDFKGHKGVLNVGDLQWMSVGRGILHSQMPSSFEEYSIAFQLWINLQSKLKMIEPVYQQYKASQIKTIVKKNTIIKILAGKWEQQTGPIFTRTPAYFFDIHIQFNDKFQLPIPSHWNAIIFVYKGSLTYQGKQKVDQQHGCKLAQNLQKEETIHTFQSETGAKFLFIGGQPLNQPIAQRGVFVMTTKQELQQAMLDFSEAKNGFENADKWQSKIQRLSDGIKYEQL